MRPGSAGASMFPMVAFDLIADAEADFALVAWEHFLGACRRPFGRQSFGLFLAGELVSVAVSASTVQTTCGGYPRGDVVELARLCSRPDHAELTRPCLRLWRVAAPGCWSRSYWPVRAVVSYQHAVKHTGDVYRFDGWRRVGVSRASGQGHRGVSKPQQDRRPGVKKVIWAFDLEASA